MSAVKKNFDEKHKYYHLINQVVDPEVGVGIADMGIVYRVDGPGKGGKSAGALPKGTVNVTMTLTSMGCPAGPEITGDIDDILREQKEIKDVEIEVVWDPPWDPDMMKPEVRAILFGGIE